mmetsp:Transcript_44254/g.71137  ORF Transcript_44254/g.71137 Transcript_44254/m.71137 type:complete len:416 (-) Transcript_44254:95-1342(-)
MSFVCNSCHFVVSSTTERADHYRSYWHRYNVKRGCEGLKPVPREVFERKLAEMSNRADGAARQNSFDCKICKKSFRTKKSYDHHINSKRHLQKAANRSGPSSQSSTPNVLTRESSKATCQECRIETDQPAGRKEKLNGKERIEERKENEVMEQEGKEKEIKEKEEEKKPVPLQHCLFCNKSAATMEECLNHMLRSHSFYIPYAQYLVSVENLMMYLGQKVGIGHQCLYCNHLFKDTEAVRQHMRDVSHCKLSFEDEEDVDEYSSFFKVPDKSKASNEQDGDGGEEDGSPSQGETKASAANTSAVVAIGGEKDLEGMASELTDLGEIVMKDGRVIGHRSLVRYYKQNLKPTDSRNTNLIIKMIRDYRAIGLPGYQQRSKRNEKNRKEVLEANKRFMKMGFKKNKQKHFKDSTAPFN